MEKLFLTSNFHQVSDLLLPLLDKNPREMKIAFIPTASNLDHHAPWIDEDKKALREMGFQIFEIDLAKMTKDILRGELKGKDIIFVGGGNTYYLLEKARASGFDEIVKEAVASGVIYVGSSAGSVLVCPRIDFIEDVDDKSVTNLDNYEGLNLIDFLILVHADDSDCQKQNADIMKKWGRGDVKLIPLKNTEAIVIKNGEVSVVTN